MKLWSVLICEDTPFFFLKNKNEKNRTSYKSEIAQTLINDSRETCSNEK